MNSSMPKDTRQIPDSEDSDFDEAQTAARDGGKRHANEAYHIRWREPSQDAAAVNASLRSSSVR
jgi:hypothetical protein